MHHSSRFSSEFYLFQIVHDICSLKSAFCTDHFTSFQHVFPPLLVFFRDFFATKKSQVKTGIDPASARSLRGASQARAFHFYTS
jgi:hypothetical protein